MWQMVILKALVILQGCYLTVLYYFIICFDNDSIWGGEEFRLAAVVVFCQHLLNEVQLSWGSRRV